MQLYGTDDNYNFWWDGPVTHTQPYGLWNITLKGDPPPLGGYISKAAIERSRRTRFDHPKMKRA